MSFHQQENVLQIEPHFVIEGQIGASGNLRESGDARFDCEDAALFK